MLLEELCPPLDAAGHARRVCPSCRAPFKVRWSRRDVRALAGAFVLRVTHLNDAEAELEALPRHCPYCGATAAPELWWTPEQRRWFDAEARDLRADVRWRTLRMPLDRLAANPRPTYVAVTPRRHAAPPPVEEADELVAVPLPCCGEEVRVARAWIGPVRCHFCGFVHARSAARDIGLELALLRGWHAHGATRSS